MKNNTNNELKPNFKETIQEISEATIDSILTLMGSADFVNQLPLIKIFQCISLAKCSIQNAHFVKKYACFIDQLCQRNESDIEKLSLNIKNKRIKQKIIDETIIYIDRYHNEFKARLLAELFHHTFISKIFNCDEYESLMYGIEQINPYSGIQCLQDFYMYRVNLENIQEDNEKLKEEILYKGASLNYQPIAMSGLLNLPIGGSYTGDFGGAYLNDLGKKFFEIVVNNIEPVTE